MYVCWKEQDFSYFFVAFLLFLIAITSSPQYLKPCWSDIWNLIIIFKLLTVECGPKMSCFNLLNMKEGRNMQSHILIKLNSISGFISLFIIWSDSQDEIILINNTWIFHVDFDVDLYNVEFYCYRLLCILGFYDERYSQ